MLVVCLHSGSELNHVNGVETPAVGVEVSHDLQCRDLRVEGVGVFQVVDPEIVDHLPEELCHPAFRRFVTCVVVDEGFVSCFELHPLDCSSIVRNSRIVEWEAGRSHERGVAMVGSVRCSLGDETCERMDSAN